MLVWPPQLEWERTEDSPSVSSPLSSPSASSPSDASPVEGMENKLVSHYLVKNATSVVS